MIESLVSMDRFRMYCISTMVDDRMVILNLNDKNVPFYADIDSAYVALNEYRNYKKDSTQVFYMCELELDTYISGLDKDGKVTRINPSAGIKIVETVTKAI